MHSQGKDEQNAAGATATATRSPAYQSIAKLAETMQNYLAQPGVELRSPNTSSDPQIGLQIPDQNAPLTALQTQIAPPDLNQKFEHENSMNSEAGIAQPALSDPGSNRRSVELSQRQEGEDSDSFVTAQGFENQSKQIEAQSHHPLTNTIQSIWSTAEAAQQNIVTAAFSHNAPTENARAMATQSEACGTAALGVQATDASVSEERPKVEKVAPRDTLRSREINEETPTQKDPDRDLRTSEVIQNISEAISQVPKAAAVDGGERRGVQEANYSGRAVRQCVKNTPNYSHTHKGITSSQLTKSKSAKSSHPQLKIASLLPSTDVTPFEAEEKEESRAEARDPAETLHGLEGKASGEDRKANSLDNKNKLVGKRTYDEICRSYENMCAFDWDLKDINNLRHPPDREVTPIVVWFYINILYFPYNAQELAKVPFEEFARPIFEQLARVQDLKAPAKQSKGSANESSFNASLLEESEVVVVEKTPALAHTAMSQMTNGVPQAEDAIQAARLGVPLEADLPELISKLQIQEHFFKFKEMFLKKMEQIRVVNKSAGDPDRDSEMDYGEEDLHDDFLPVVADDNDESVFDLLIGRFEAALQKLNGQNKAEMEKQYQRFANAYRDAEAMASLIIEGKQRLVPRPTFPFNPTRLDDYGLDFLSYVDPYFVADVRENLEWYLQNQNEVLLNVSYPSKQEKEFLRHIEQWQQEKNDLNYKRILQQLAEGADDPNSKGPNGLNIQRYNSLSAHQRGLVVQEDAQCAICNNGDYEDEDQIVFCGACNIPVHQKCYGIDEIPDNDWICNNCRAFNMTRGIMTRCILCPKRGGAMKPTSIFRTYEHFMRYHTAAQKKKGLHHNNYFANLASTRIASDDMAANDEFEQLDAEQLEIKVDASLQLSCSLPGKQSNSNRQRLQFFEREDKNHALSQIISRECNFQEALIMQKKEAGENFPQSNVDLHFLESEAIAEIPEDYTFFLQRNEQRLECPSTVPTETLYEWVHLSCAMWIPGPTVTPKTPVRMSKIDLKRFDLQCIICGKRNCGACIQCQHSRCMISFHVECARRANYFLEIERVDRERNYRVFCEKHRPLKIVREMEEKDRQTVEEVQKFSKVIDRCMEIYARAEIKQARSRRMQPFSKPVAPSLPCKRELLAERKQQKLDLIRQKKQQRENEIYEKKEQARQKKERERMERENQRKQKLEAACEFSTTKKTPEPELRRETIQKSGKVGEPAPAAVKWREKDKKVLFERVRCRFIQLVKLRVNVLYVDPMVKIKKRQEMMAKKNEKELRRVEKKRREKQNQKVQAIIARKIQIGSNRTGLRSRSMNNQSEVPLDGDNNASAFADMSYSERQNGIELNLGPENPELSSSQRRREDEQFFRCDQQQGEAEREGSESDELDRRPTIEELLNPEQLEEPYFKLAAPTHAQELDWAITFSKYDFPWHEIRFDNFSARECYRKYTSSIRDAQTFYKKILSGKEKYKKLIAGQLDEAQRVFFSVQPDENAQTAQMGSPRVKEQVKNDEAHESKDIELFCKCRGEFNSLTGYFVMCENETNCRNGGWLHPECTRDLRQMTQEDIMKIEKWFCEDCLDDKREQLARGLTVSKKTKDKHRAKDSHSRQRKRHGKRSKSSSNNRPRQETSQCTQTHVATTKTQQAIDHPPPVKQVSVNQILTTSAFTLSTPSSKQETAAATNFLSKAATTLPIQTVLQPSSLSQKLQAIQPLLKAPLPSQPALPQSGLASLLQRANEARKALTTASQATTLAQQLPALMTPPQRALLNLVFDQNQSDKSISAMSTLVNPAHQLPQIASLAAVPALSRSQQQSQPQKQTNKYVLPPPIPSHQQAQPLLPPQILAPSMTTNSVRTKTIQQKNADEFVSQPDCSSSKVILNFGTKLGNLTKFTSSGSSNNNNNSSK